MSLLFRAVACVSIGFAISGCSESPDRSAKISSTTQEYVKSFSSPQDTQLWFHNPKVMSSQPVDADRREFYDSAIKCFVSKYKDKLNRINSVIFYGTNNGIAILMNAIRDGLLSRDMHVLMLPEDCSSKTTHLQYPEAIMLSEAINSGNLVNLKNLVVAFEDEKAFEAANLGSAILNGKLSNLKNLSIVVNGFGQHTSNCMLSVIKAITKKSPPYLESFDFTGDCVDDRVAIELSNSIKCGKLQSLYELRLHGKNLGDRGAFAIAKMLSRMDLLPCLYTLDFSDTGIKSIGAERLKKVVHQRNEDKKEWDSLSLSINSDRK